MPENVRKKDLEARILEVAKTLFVEKGFAETSMSEIAGVVGINRPALHYYFRTKSRMFKAVFGLILQSVAPRLQDIMLDTTRPIGERISAVVDIYYDVFRANPCLPLFVMREIERDVDYLLRAARGMHMDERLCRVVSGLRDEMEQGRLNVVPLRFVFYTFYSLLVFPFLTKKLGVRLLAMPGETFDEMLERWKPYVVSQMEHLLCVR